MQAECESRIVLVADLDAEFAQEAVAELSKGPFVPEVVASLDAMNRRLDASTAAVTAVLIDIRLAGRNIPAFFQQLTMSHPETQVFVTSGFLHMDRAVESLGHGVADIVTRPALWPRVRHILDRLLNAGPPSPVRAEPEAPTPSPVDLDPVLELQLPIPPLDPAPQPPSSPTPSRPVAPMEAIDFTVDVDYSRVSAFDFLLTVTPAFPHLDLLLSGKLGDLPVEQQEALVAIQESLGWLRARVRDHVMGQASDPTTPPLSLEIVALAPLLDWTVEMFRPRAYEVGVELTLDVPADLTAYVDKDRLLLVVFALLENALGCTRSGGQVTVRATLEQQCARLAVIDEGPGIEPAQFETIFECFYRMDGSQNSGGEGLGLGLSSARYNARLMNSEVDVSSELGVGSRFSLTLPCTAR